MHCVSMALVLALALAFATTLPSSATLSLSAVAAGAVPGNWSAAHNGTWCEKGALLQDLGKGVALQKCQSACEAQAGCSYVCHADQTDRRCMLYKTCPTPRCGSASGWFTTYQLMRPDSLPWPARRCPPPPPPPHPPPPAKIGGMSATVVSPKITEKHGAKCLDGTPPAYSIRAGTGVNASRFIIFLEGGGCVLTFA